jgi:SAM-dependent methyltransferase
MSEPDPARLARFKEAMRREWAASAPGWRATQAQHAYTTAAATEALLAAARVGPGMRVLDLASGTGEPALTLAERVGPDGEVTATDLVPEMLAAAEDAARARGLRNIRFQQADAEALPFPDAHFDVVTCRFGVMFFPDVGRALGEAWRVLRPAGRAAFVAQGPLAQNPYMAVGRQIATKYAPTPSPEPGAPDSQRFAIAGTLAAALRAAGFRDVMEEARAIVWPVPGPLEAVWDLVREHNRTVRRLVTERPPEEVAQIRAEVLAAAAPYHDGQETRFPAVIVLASGVR